MQGWEGFSGTRDGNSFDFDIAFAFGNGVVEMIDHTRPLLYDGTAHATMTDGRISGTYSGRIALYDSTRFVIYQPAPYDCQATDHKIEFTR